jgi:hypothetical protein
MAITAASVWAMRLRHAEAQQQNEAKAKGASIQVHVGSPL